MLGGPLKAIALAQAPELAKAQEPRPQEFFPERLPEELCRGPGVFP